MKVVQWISFTLWLIMTFSIGYGLIYGDFWGEGAQLLQLLWGKLTLIDFYVGITLFSMWIVYREKKVMHILIWIFFFIILGNWTTALYVFITCIRSRGDWQVFWQG
ncbi:DUF1475 family protein [Hazenella sp. IB182357]|uniref:DUF1475 family protein n=2 Tax=Polycladospora coralii TaxID=2771432 RepID=A0A926NH78_9BACL|nr:DUF1475 family protein [Polycladospora coralii]